MESYGPLVADLEQRLMRVGGELSARAKQREEQANQAYNLVQRTAHGRDAAERIKRIDGLLLQYGDCAIVREHETELRELRQQLALIGKPGSEAQVQEQYAPTQLSLPSSGRVRMEFVCSTERSAAWNLGDWQARPDGWVATRKHSKLELENETLWPRLLLERQFDLGAPLDVEFQIEQLATSGPPQRFVASVAGVYVAVAKGQIAVAAGGPSALHELMELLDRGKGKPIDGFERGQTHVLRVVLGQGRGKLEASIDDQVVLVQDFLRPEGKGGSTSVVVRSIEPVLLKRVIIEAGLSGK
jgi:hypothetical protein